MSDLEDAPGPSTKVFVVEKAKQGRAVCKKCKEKCLKGELRLGKLVPNPFGEGQMKAWHHPTCLFELFTKQRPTTKRIESSNDLDGFELLAADDRQWLEDKIGQSNKLFVEKNGGMVVTPPKQKNKTSKSSDDTFTQFCHLIDAISNENKYLEKSKLVARLFEHGPNGGGFTGDHLLWCRMLLPATNPRVYNLQSKQLIKLFSRLYHQDTAMMLTHLEKNGDVSETISCFFERNTKYPPQTKSVLTLKEIDDFLQTLSTLSKEDEQIDLFKTIVKLCTVRDLKTIIRLIKQDLRINAKAKHILQGVHKDAYEIYQSSMDLKTVITKCLLLTKKNENAPSKSQKNEVNITLVKAAIDLFTPVIPMLAESCNSVEQAFKKYPNGMYSEIKYDGERVQVHKRGSEFKYFSRNLKPVMAHKVAHFHAYITQAFPHAHDLILDTEILLMDCRTGKPLPFGTLGVHKRSAFHDATVCLFVFDCIYYNGEMLTGKPLMDRKRILRESMIEIPNRIVFSEMKEIRRVDDLSLMIARVLRDGLEGLVLKGFHSFYEPGKRHWLKIKKDYLFDGAMADTADLIVLGAWYGTGKKGGMMSIFLMGCYCGKRKKFCTVTKVHTGHDDETLLRLQSDLNMIKTGDNEKRIPPEWLLCHKTMIPDVVACDPTKQPVWEITGAEFTKNHDVHTADGISVRFPRVTRMRDDKDWKTATSLAELKELYRKSKDNTTTDVSLLLKNIKEDANVKEPSKDFSAVASSSKKQADETPSRNSQESGSKMERKTGSNRKRKLLTEDGKSEEEEVLLTQNPSKSEKKVTNPLSRTEDDQIPLKREKYSTMKETTSKRKSLNLLDSLKKKLKRLDDIEIKNPLPQYFTGVRLLVEDGCAAAIEGFSELIRYFRVYDGTVLKADECMTATHVLHLEDLVYEQTIKCPKSARHIIVDWIKDTIRNGSLQDYRPYTVHWKGKSKI